MRKATPSCYCRHRAERRVPRRSWWTLSHDLCLRHRRPFEDDHVLGLRRRHYHAAEIPQWKGAVERPSVSKGRRHSSVDVTTRRHPQPGQYLEWVNLFTLAPRKAIFTVLYFMKIFGAKKFEANEKKSKTILSERTGIWHFKNYNFSHRLCPLFEWSNKISTTTIEQLTLSILMTSYFLNNCLVFIVTNHVDSI